MSGTHFYEDFPFNELRALTGDFYDNKTQLERAGFEESQMVSSRV